MYGIGVKDDICDRVFIRKNAETNLYSDNRKRWENWKIEMSLVPTDKRQTNIPYQIQSVGQTISHNVHRPSFILHSHSHSHQIQCANVSVYIQYKFQYAKRMSKLDSYISLSAKINKMHENGTANNIDDFLCIPLSNQTQKLAVKSHHLHNHHSFFFLLSLSVFSVPSFVSIGCFICSFRSFWWKSSNIKYQFFEIPIWISIGPIEPIPNWKHLFLFSSDFLQLELTVLFVPSIFIVEYSHK